MLALSQSFPFTHCDGFFFVHHSTSTRIAGTPSNCLWPPVLSTTVCISELRFSFLSFYERNSLHHLTLLFFIQSLRSPSPPAYRLLLYCNWWKDSESVFFHQHPTNLLIPSGHCRRPLFSLALLTSPKRHLPKEIWEGHFPQCAHNNQGSTSSFVCVACGFRTLLQSSPCPLCLPPFLMQQICSNVVLLASCNSGHLAWLPLSFLQTISYVMQVNGVLPYPFTPAICLPIFSTWHALQ